MRSARTEEKVVLSLDDMDIDHILPQSWAEYWPLANSMAVSQQEVSDAVLLSYTATQLSEKSQLIANRQASVPCSAT